jgi:hypothetical protein
MNRSALNLQVLVKTIVITPLELYEYKVKKIPSLVLLAPRTGLLKIITIFWL